MSCKPQIDQLKPQVDQLCLTSHKVGFVNLHLHNIQQKVGVCSEPCCTKGGNVGVFLPSSSCSCR